MQGKKVAIVVDWLTDVGGAERVIRSIHEIFPDAPIYTSQYNPKQLDWFDGADVRYGWLQKIPFFLRKFLPILRMVYFSKLNLSEYDIIISCTGAEAKAVKSSDGQLNVSYMHAPTQYYWSLHEQYMKDPGFGLLNPLVRLFLRLSVGSLRKFDFKYAQIPDQIISNSTYIAHEIKKHYKRDSVIISPPVDVSSFKLNTEKDNYFIITSRHVPWKKVGLVVQACIKTNERLIVVGEGTEHDSLVAMAAGHSNIEFVDTISDTKKLARLVAGAKGFLFPSLEPFGIAPVEALATGTPVIAYKAGGALDYINSKNGMFFNEQTAESIADAFIKFKTNLFDALVVAESAQKFSDASFKSQMKAFIDEKLAEKSQKS
jgi:glycosyltransferase involved in cell wall biosynthesis